MSPTLNLWQASYLAMLWCSGSLEANSTLCMRLSLSLDLLTGTALYCDEDVGHTVVGIEHIAEAAACNAGEGGERGSEDSRAIRCGLCR